MRILYFLLCLIPFSVYGQVAVRAIHGQATNITIKSIGGTNGLAVNTNALVVTSGGRVGIGELSPDEALEVNGNISTSSTGSVGTVTVPSTNMVTRQVTVVGTGPGQVNLTGTNGAISSIEAGSPVGTNNTLRLPVDAQSGPMISTNVAGGTNQIGVVIGGTDGQAFFKTSVGYAWSNVVSGGTFPLSADGNAAGFDITNVFELAVGGVGEGGTRLPAFYIHGTNNSGQPVIFRFTSTNSLLRLDSSVNGAAYGAPLTYTGAGVLGSSSAINSGGNVTALGFISAAAASQIAWTGRSAMASPADGQITLRNAASVDFRGLLFRDATAASPSFIVTNGIIRVGDGTGNWANPTNALFFPTTIDTTATTTTNIHRQSGCVRLAAGQQTYIVTNMYATTTAVIVPSVTSDDATLKSLAVIRSAGYFTLKGNTNATADCDLCFFISSP